VVIIVSVAGGGTTVKLSVCWTVWDGAELSVSVNMCVVVACVVGVPVIVPAAVSSERLAGSAGETDHVYGSAPPEALREAE
jgi:hydroxymethylglutaryl-CoA reductase